MGADDTSPNQLLRARHEIALRQLAESEAERDALKARVADLKFAMGKGADWFDRFVAMRGERDALKAEVAELSQHVCDECDGNGIYRIDGVPLPCVCVSEPEGAELVRAEARKEAEAERDSALAKVAKLKSTLDDLLGYEGLDEFINDREFLAEAARLVSETKGDGT